MYVSTNSLAFSFLKACKFSNQLSCTSSLAQLLPTPTVFWALSTEVLLKTGGLVHRF